MKSKIIFFKFSTCNYHFYDHKYIKQTKHNVGLARVIRNIVAGVLVASGLHCNLLVLKP